MSSLTASISVVIATRDRGDRVTDTVDSILNNKINTPLAFEILVVDQSTNKDCLQAMQKYKSDPRVKYQQTTTTGMARARNIAIAQARSSLIAITDDDCIVAENWLASIQAAFQAHPDVAILFGNVHPAECDTSQGFIPSYCREKERIVSDPLSKNDIDGLGACMALRKEVWKALGGFDEMLGAGGVLKSSSEGDLVIHALHQGHQVCELPAVSVVHHGFRTWAEGEGLIARYWYGTGAMYGKHLKLYPIATFMTLALLGWRWAFGRSRVADSLGNNTRKSARLIAFVSGFSSGLWIKVDRATGHFKPDSSKEKAMVYEF